MAPSYYCTDSGFKWHHQQDGRAHSALWGSSISTVIRLCVRQVQKGSDNGPSHRPGPFQKTLTALTFKHLCPKSKPNVLKFNTIFQANCPKPPHFFHAKLLGSNNGTPWALHTFNRLYMKRHSGSSTAGLITFPWKAKLKLLNSTMIQAVWRGPRPYSWKNTSLFVHLNFVSLFFTAL